MKSEVFCIMLAGDSENKQKENESNINEKTAGASETESTADSQGRRIQL